MLIKAPAKINLTLRIISKRADGYHEISSEMQAIRLFDEVDISLSAGRDGANSITCRVGQGGENRFSLSGVPEGQGNLAWWAAELAIKTWRPGLKEGLSVDIVLRKNIPAAAGLAGGSSNAAAVLLGLAKELKPEAELDEIAALGAKLGADIPFCLYSCAEANPELGYEGKGLALAEGIGDLILPVHARTPGQESRRAKVLLVKPDIEVSTKAIFELYDQESPEPAVHQTESPNDLEEYCTRAYPAVAEAIKVLNEIRHQPQKGQAKNGSLPAKIQLTGSGPTVFVYIPVPARWGGGFSHSGELCENEFNEAVHCLYTRARAAFPSMFVHLTETL